MFNKIFSILMILIFSILIANPSFAEAPNLKDRMEKRINQAVNFIELLDKGKYENASKLLSAKTRKALPAAGLKKVWNQVTSQAGKYEKYDNVTIAAALSEGKDYIVVTVTCRFKESLLDAKIAFNEIGEISGLFFSEADEKSTYELPPYVIGKNFREIEIEIGDSKPLPASLSMPEGKGPFPVVILVHGSGPQDRDEQIGPNMPFRDIAWGLATKGIAVIRYDKRTKVYPDDFSGDITVEEETVNDAVIAAEQAKNIKGIDPGKIYILGHSLGGMVIPRIAQKTGTPAGYIMMAATARPVEDVIVEQYTYILNLDGDLTGEEKEILDDVEDAAALVKSKNLTTNTPASSLPLGLPASYWIDLNNYSPTEMGKQIKKPALILQGARDYQVTMADFNAWVAAFSDHRNKEFKVYDNLNHLFIKGEGPSMPSEYKKEGHVSEKVIKDIYKWIRTVE